MPLAGVGPVRLHYELHGRGETLVLVHGAWGDATQWGAVIGQLAEQFEVLIYDRRGHGRSEGGDGNGTLEEDAHDLADLLHALDRGPAHVVGNSSGGNIALRTAMSRPEVVRSLNCHEPPLWALIAQDPEVGPMLQEGGAAIAAVLQRIASSDNEGAARQFVDEVAVGPGAWDSFPTPVQEMFVRNAGTVPGEFADPEHGAIDLQAFAALNVPVRLTAGSESAPTFWRVIDRLAQAMPRAERVRMEGVGHVPFATAPEQFVEVTASVPRGPID